MSPTTDDAIADLPGAMDLHLRLTCLSFEAILDIRPQGLDRLAFGTHASDVRDENLPGGIHDN